METGCPRGPRTAGGKNDRVRRLLAHRAVGFGGETTGHRSDPTYLGAMRAREDRPADVLVVDDDQHVLEALLDVLSEEGYSVRAARDGIEALQAIRERRPDLVVTDLMMPSMNGWE